MTINWQDVLTTLVATVGGGGVLLAAAAWLIKAVLTDRRAREAEEFRTRLKADADAQIERLKNSPQMAALEHQVRFSKLHERRAEVIAEVYARLVTVSLEGKYFVVRGGGHDKPSHEVLFSKTEGTIRDFLLFVEMNRIYIPVAVCSVLDKITTAMIKAVVEVGVYGGIEYPNEKTRAEINDVFTKAFKAFEEEIPEAKKALEREFRAILGESLGQPL